MQVKSIAECPKGSILQYFRPALSYHLSLRSLFCLLFYTGFPVFLSHTFVVHKHLELCLETSQVDVAYGDYVWWQERSLLLTWILSFVPWSEILVWTNLVLQFEFRRETSEADASLEDNVSQIRKATFPGSDYEWSFLVQNLFPWMLVLTR